MLNDAVHHAITSSKSHGLQESREKRSVPLRERSEVQEVLFEKDAACYCRGKSESTDATED